MQKLGAEVLSEGSGNEAAEVRAAQWLSGHVTRGKEKKNRNGGCEEGMKLRWGRVGHVIEWPGDGR